MTDLFLKNLSDLSLYFAVVGAFPLLFVRDLFLLLPALICTAAAVLAMLLRNQGKLRYLGALLSLTVFLLADTQMERLLLIPPVVYTVLQIKNQAFGMDYYEYRERFLQMLKLFGIFCGLVFAMGYFEGMFGKSWGTYDIGTVLFYGAVSGFSGVFLLRQLRLGADSRKEDRRRNTIQMLLVLGVILVLAGSLVAAEELLHDFVSNVLYWVMAAVGFVPMVFHEILRWFMRDPGEAYLESVEALQSRPNYTGEVSIPEGTGAPAPLPQEPGFPWWFAILVIVALCAALVYLLRSMTLRSGGMADLAEEEKLEGEKPGSPEKGRSNRSKIRKLYRTYLKQQRKQGVKLESNMTSRDILNRAGPQTDREAASQLRQLYVKARYAAHQSVTREEVEQAKQALQQSSKASR